MKKIISGLGAVALMLSLQVAAPTAALAEMPEDQAELFAMCESFAEEYPTFTQGECVALFTSMEAGQGINGFAGQICHIILDTGATYEDLGVKNHGECVKLVREEFSN